MTRDEAKQMWPIIKAYSEGAEIEYRLRDTAPFSSIYDPSFHDPVSRYRIKPTPKLRPWTPAEAIGKAVRKKSWCEDGSSLVIGTNGNGSSYDAQLADFHGVIYRVGAEELLKDYILLDGSPCGVEVSE